MSTCGNCGSKTVGSDICDRCEEDARMAEQAPQPQDMDRAREWLMAEFGQDVPGWVADLAAEFSRVRMETAEACAKLVADCACPDCAGRGHDTDNMHDCAQCDGVGTLHPLYDIVQAIRSLSEPSTPTLEEDNSW